MGLAWPHWLATRATRAALRQLLDHHARTPRSSPRRRLSAVASGSGVRNQYNDDESEKPSTTLDAQRWTMGRHDAETADTSNETALRISLSAGVQLLEPSTPPGESLRALQRQADVGSGRASGDLAIDRPENRGNLKLWAELLEYRRRVDGFEGVLDVWRGMRRRNVDLPIKGSEADSLWTTFAQAGIRSPHEDRHDRLLQNVVDHARDLYTRAGVYDGLHTCIVGRWLRLKPAVARTWHRVLCKDFDISRIDWHALANDFASTKELYQARKTFRAMYTSSQQRELYGYYMPIVLRQHGDEEALRWHKMFLKHGDGPDRETFANPAIQRLFELDDGASLPMVHAKPDVSAAKPLITAHDQAQFPPLTRATMSTIVGDVHGIKPKEVSDSFVAKMFATFAFSLDLVITGLGFFGVDNLGALAVREMALKAGTFAVFSNKLGDLKACGIGVERSVYGRLMKKITVEGSVQLFEALIASDQHPESYEDGATQELLLHSFLLNGDWLNAHITLMGLSLAGRAQHESAWNRLLQHYIKGRDYRSISRTAEQMRTSGMAFNKRTLTFMHRYVLPIRRPGKAPYKTANEARILSPLQFTTNAYIHSAKNGVTVNDSLWIENLKRYGMMHRWIELERLVLWLAHWYSTHAAPFRYMRGGRWIHRPGMLQKIFTRQMREAIVTWGFRNASLDRMSQPSPNGEASPPCEPWAKGLELLNKLCRYGVHTTPETARAAFLKRMWVLIGPAYSTKAINEEAKRNNQLTLAHYVRHADQIWDGRLFPHLSESLTTDDPENHPKLLVALFGKRHRVSKQRQESADVVAYARVLDQRRALNMPSRRNGLARHKLWRLSPFRRISPRVPTARVEMRRQEPFRH